MDLFYLPVLHSRVLGSYLGAGDDTVKGWHEWPVDCRKYKHNRYDKCYVCVLRQSMGHQGQQQQYHHRQNKNLTSHPGMEYCR